jgi:hypothetical protein
LLDTTTLLALVTGHLLGDFALQTDGLAERKARRHRWLLVHVAVVAGATWLLLGSLAAWPFAAALFLVHLGIDLFKRHLGPRPAADPDAGAGGTNVGSLRWFLLDQALHALSLAGFWWAIGAFAPDLPARNLWAGLWGASYGEGLLVVAGFTTAVWTLSVVLMFQMAEFAAGLPRELSAGLPRGGRTVGKLERLLVYVFVLGGQPEAIGFVVAAKSVFRIGDLTNRDERDHAEYIMVGTLRSFAYALLLALAVRWLRGLLAG